MPDIRDIEELEGFWIDGKRDRALHIGFEDEDTVYIDLFDSVDAAYTPEGNECLIGVLLNLITGELRIEKATKEV